MARIDLSKLNDDARRKLAATTPKPKVRGPIVVPPLVGIVALAAGFALLLTPYGLLGGCLIATGAYQLGLAAARGVANTLGDQRADRLTDVLALAVLRRPEPAVAAGGTPASQKAISTKPAARKRRALGRSNNDAAGQQPLRVVPTLDSPLPGEPAGIGEGAY